MKYLTVLALSAFLFFSCKEETPATVETVLVKDIVLPTEIFQPITEEALSIPDAKTKKAGEAVVVSGKVMGSHTVFVENRASFIIGNPDKLTSCNLRKGDSCKSPWDVCCEAKKDVQANTLSVQVLDKDGKIFKTLLEGKSGLEKLSEVIVKGTISDQSSDTVTIINAETIQVK